MILTKTAHHVPFFLLLSATSIIKSMDAPQQFLSPLIVTKNKFYINFADDKQAFHDLTKDNACVLKNLVAQERRGRYNPILRRAEELLHKVYPTTGSSLTVIKKTPTIHKDFTEINCTETREFVWLIAKKNFSTVFLMQAIENQDRFEASKIMETNLYVVNTYVHIAIESLDLVIE